MSQAWLDAAPFAVLAVGFAGAGLLQLVFAVLDRRWERRSRDGRSG